MASKRRGRGQTKSQSVREFRKDIAKLKRAGLLSKSVDARRAKPTKFLKSQQRKFRPFLEGKAKVVKAPSRIDARDYASYGMTVKGLRIVVPVQSKDARVYFSRKGARRYKRKGKWVWRGGTVTEKRFQSGKNVTARIVKKHYANIKQLPRGDNLLYRITFAHGRTHTEDTPEGLAAFMFGYETDPVRPWKNWLEYVEVLEIDDEGDDEE